MLLTPPSAPLCGKPSSISAIAVESSNLRPATLAAYIDDCWLRDTLIEFYGRSDRGS